MRKNVLATYRKHIIDARFQSLADKSKNINLNQEERILQLSVGKVADTRLTNVLYKEEIRTVGQLLELVSGKGWRWLLKMEGVGGFLMTACCPIFSWREWSMKVWSRYFPVALTDDYWG